MLVRRDGQPNIFCQLALQLPFAPFGITNTDQSLIHRTFFRQVFNHIARRSQRDVIGYHHTVLPAADRRMHDIAALNLNRSAHHHIFMLQAQRDIAVGGGENHVHGNRRRLVDDDAQRTFFIVFAHINDRIRKKRIVHMRHGNQEMVG